jgi:hypothetical protein
MYQQSDSDNPASDAAQTGVGQTAAIDSDPDAVLFSQMPLPTLFGRYIGDGEDDDVSLGELTYSLAERVLGSEGDAVASGDASLSTFDHPPAVSRDETRLAWFSSSYSTLAATPGSSVERVDPAVRIAHFLRIVGSVASREVILDASHRPPPEGPEYDARRLLVAAYNVVVNAERVARRKPLAKSAFGRLAANIQNNVFSNWTKQFEKHLSDAGELWLQLGFDESSDVRATVARLEALHESGVPMPTVEDLIASPFYRKLAFIQQSSVSEAERRKVMHARSALASSSASHSTASSTMGPLPRIVTAWPSGGHGGDARDEAAGFPSTQSVAPPDFTLPGALDIGGHLVESETDAALRMAHFLRILGSVASRDVIPDESHRPPADSAEYDARCLLVAAYNALSMRGQAEGAKLFSKRKFSRFAVGMHSNRFSDWTKLFENRLGEATVFWAQLGLDARHDARATIEQLEAQYDANVPKPTVQDLIDSPFYRRLSFIKQSGVTDAERGNAKRARLSGVTGGTAVGEAGGSLLASGVIPSRFFAAASHCVGSANHAHVRAHGDIDHVADIDRGSVDAMHLPCAAARSVSRDSAETRGAAAMRIATLLRTLGGVANREIRFDESHRPPTDGPVYDARCLLVAAYNMLSRNGHSSGSHIFSKRHFNRLAVQINSGLFCLWTLRLEAHLSEASRFWADFGLDDRRNAQATIDCLEALQDAASPAPTVQDLIASPLYRKLAFSGQNRFGGESLKVAKRPTTEKASTTEPSLLMIDESSEALPWSEVPISFNALGASTQSRPDAISPDTVTTARDRQWSRRCGTDDASHDPHHAPDEGASAPRSSMVTPPTLSP